MTTLSNGAPLSNPEKTGQELIRKTIGKIPRKDADFAVLCQHVAENWLQDSHIVWRKMTAQEFDTLTQQFADKRSTRLNAGGHRPSETLELNLLDREMTQSISVVKHHLAIKYGKNRSAYYSLFGLEKNKKSYILPYDREKRIDALEQILIGIQECNLQTVDVGLMYWTDFATRYRAAYDRVFNTNTDIHGSVGSKNLLRTELTEALRNVIKLIEVQYGEEARTVLLQWGFRRVNY